MSSFTNDYYNITKFSRFLFLSNPQNFCPLKISSYTVKYSELDNNSPQLHKVTLTAMTGPDINKFRSAMGNTKINT